MRLVGTLQPLRPNDVPQDSFETEALARAMTGQDFTGVQKVEGKWFDPRSVALSNFHVACAMCHTNFGPLNDKQWVGALMLRVPEPTVTRTETTRSSGVPEDIGPSAGK